MAEVETWRLRVVVLWGAWGGDQLGQRYDQGKSREGFPEPASTAPCLAIVEPSVSGGHSLFLDMTTSQKQP